MSIQVLSPKKVRRVARETGLSVVAARRVDNYTWLIVTDDHEHYAVSVGTWEYEPSDVHWTSCAERFGGKA